MKKLGVVFLSVFVLMMSFFCSAALGDDWDSFDGGSSGGASVDTGGSSSDVGSGFGDSAAHSSGVYTRDFYIALGVGAFGLLILAVFLYFFFRRPKNRWEKKRKAHK